MANASIGGLASGLDTATIINQLMQLEAAPQSKLKSRLTTAQTSVASLQTLNTQIAGIATRAKALADIANWSPLKANSSHGSVTASTSAGSTPGTWTIQVDQLATTHRMRFNDSAALTDAVVSGGTTVDLTIGGVTTTIDTGDGTLAGLVSALNASDTGVNASTVRLDDGSHRLVVQSTRTGEANQFTLTAANGDPLLSGATVVAGRDAGITVEGQTVHSTTNTFTGVLPGLTITVGADSVGRSVDVTVSTDTTSAANAVKALVDQLNNVIGQIESLTGYNSTSKTKGALAGDSAVRAVSTALQQSIFPPDNTSLARMGLQTDRYGKVTFDEAVFNQALKDNPTDVANAITGPNGFASRVERVASGASHADTGTISEGITGRNSSIAQLETSIEAWDVRLQLRRTNLERTYTALETAMSRMQSQSSWLAGQLNSLSNSSNR